MKNLRKTSETSSVPKIPLILDNTELRRELEDLREDSDGKFRIVFETLDQLLTLESKPKKKIGFTAKEKLARYGNK